MKSLIKLTCLTLIGAIVLLGGEKTNSVEAGSFCPSGLCVVDNFNISSKYWSWNNPSGIVPGSGQLSIYTVPTGYRLEIKSWRNANEGAQPFQPQPQAELWEEKSSVFTQRLSGPHFNKTMGDRHGFVVAEVGGITFDEGSQVFLDSTAQLDYSKIFLAGVLKPKSWTGYVPSVGTEEVIDQKELSNEGWSWANPNPTVEPQVLENEGDRYEVYEVPAGKSLVFSVRSINTRGFKILEITPSDQVIQRLNDSFTGYLNDIDQSGNVLKRSAADRFGPGSKVVIEVASPPNQAVNLNHFVMVGELIDE